MKLITIFTFATLAGLAAVTTQNAAAEGIGVNFTGNAWFLQSTDQPGIVSGGNWNNVNGSSGTNFVLHDAAAASTTALLSFASTGADPGLDVSSTANAATNLLYRGGLWGDNTIREVSIQLSNIPFRSYDVYVYASPVAGPTNTLSITDGVTNFYYRGTGQNNSSATSLLQTTSTDSFNPTSGAAQYQVFRGLTNSSFGLTTGGSITSVIANHVMGLQIVPAPLRVLPTTPAARPQALSLPTRSAGATGLTLVTHGWRDSASSPGSWAQDLAADVGSHTTSAWDVRAYDWGQYSGSCLTGPGYAMRNADYIGTALGEQIRSMGYTSVHFIGHSAGSWLIDGAADALAGSGITIQSTFLDSYVPPGGSSFGFGANSLGDSATWSEQYYHDGITPFTQATLGSAVNFDITGLNTSGANDHSWPYIWYDSTAENPSGSNAQGWGFQRSLEFSNMPSHATYSRGSTIVLGQPPGGGLNETTPATLFPITNFQQSDNILSGTGTITIEGTALTLATGSPVWINSLLESDKPFNLLTFTYDFLSDTEGLLSVYLDGNLLLLLDEQLLPDIALTESLWLGTDYAPGTHYLSFRLDPQSTEQSQVSISNVSLGTVVPEPSVAFLCIFGVALFLIRRTAPNHALQRTAPGVTAPAISCPDASPPSHLFP